MPSLAQVLAANVREAAPELWEPIERNRIRCYACGHRCPIPQGQPGVCKVRFNEGGKLFAPWGYVAGVACDPIEKKPFFHVRPGALAFSVGMLGCDLHCSYCQNWVTSQALRDPNAGGDMQHASPEQLARLAVRYGADAVVSTYNEPLITAEWAHAIFDEARKAGMLTGFVSNGNATEKVLDYLRPCLDLYKVDLKSFDDRHYRQLGGRLEPILDSVRLIHSMGLWLEVVTLLVPDFNNSDAELAAMAEFLASVSPDIPWHVTAFHKDYRMTDPGNTTPEMLERAAEIGRRAGLRFVYAGNLPGMVGGLEDTRCHQCGELLVKRWGYRIESYRIAAGGACPACNTQIPGRWR